MVICDNPRSFNVKYCTRGSLLPLCRLSLPGLVFLGAKLYHYREAYLRKEETLLNLFLKRSGG